MRLTGTSTMSLVLGELLAGLSGSMVNCGVGAGEPTSTRSLEVALISLLTSTFVPNTAFRTSSMILTVFWLASCRVATKKEYTSCHNESNVSLSYSLRSWSNFSASPLAQLARA